MPISKRPRTEEEISEGIFYDINGRLAYHPEFHSSHKQPFTLEELVYLCKFVHQDGIKSMSLALGKTEKTVSSQLQHLKKMGFYEVMRGLSDEEWERIIDRGKQRRPQVG